MYKIVLVRHGQSIWNQENRFTGWVDVGLTDQGIEEAHRAGKSLKAAGFAFDIAFTSVLKRATKTLEIILEELGEQDIEVCKSWRLNERHYGALQGLNKAETAAKYGEDKVNTWRRGYDVAIPPLSKDSDMYPGNDPLYAGLDQTHLPVCENLKDVVDRIIPYWHDEIIPKIKDGHRVIIAASGNSLRALVKYIDQMSEDKIMEFNMPTGIPMIYELDADLKPTKRYFLADEKTLKQAIDVVKNQGKADEC